MIMQRSGHVFKIGLLLIGILAMAGCGKNSDGTAGKKGGGISSQSAPGTAGEPVMSAVKPALTVGVLPDLDSIPLVIAEAEGYFAAAGVNVTLEHFTSPLTRDSALQSGEVDGAVSDLLAVAFARSAGFGVKATSATDGSYKLLVARNSGIHKVSQLAGHSIAMSLNTIIEYTTDRMLKASGVSPDAVEKSAVSQIPVRLEMLSQGKIDAATLPDPLATVAMNNGATLLMSSGDLGINPGVIVFTDAALAHKESSVKAFYAAYNRAVTFLRTKPEQSYIDLLIEKAGLPSEVRNSLHLPEYQPAHLPPDKEVKEVLAWLTAKGLIKKSFSYGELVDTKVAGKN